MAKTARVNQKCTVIINRCIQARHSVVWNPWENRWVPELCLSCDRMVGKVAGN